MFKQRQSNIICLVYVANNSEEQDGHHCSRISLNLPNWGDVQLYFH